ncbi:sigma-54-dependent transcriptional regulator [Melittangium boletus]|nr:sigma 54-interacting transcriptional regulator [Melittangium boletus]
MGAAMGEWLPMLRVFAQQEETLLICGATGTGKSRLARWFHAHSRRRDEAFEVLDLLSVPEELQMAELVGWKRGAFTGAVGSNVGSVARAEGGTLFIDEIDKLSLRAQAGLLHLLEERGYRALGEDSGKKRANVRFIIGTNADLLGAVRAGHFREDLYYRINVLPFRLPPLDERRDEIRPWARFMVERCKREHGPSDRVRLTAGAEQLLSSRSWPGNLRQLDNIVRRAFSLALVEAGGSGEVVIEEGSMARALACEAMPGPKPLSEALRRTARSFVEEARRREIPLDLDLADAFRGFVLGAAVQELGRDEAFRVLGREGLLRNRNHHKVLKREVERVNALLTALGEEDSSFSQMLTWEQ